MVSNKQTPIEKAAVKVACYFVELPKPQDIDEVVAIIRQTLKDERQKFYTDFETDYYESIRDTAERGLRRHMSSVRGQQFSPADGYDYWAMMEAVHFSDRMLGLDD